VADLLRIVAAVEKMNNIKAYEEKVIATELLGKAPKAGKVVAKKKMQRWVTTELTYQTASLLL